MGVYIYIYRERSGQVTKLELECPPPRSAARLLDKLCGHFIEDHIVTDLDF